MHFNEHPPNATLADTESATATEFITAYFPTDYSEADQKTFSENLDKFFAIVRPSTKDVVGGVHGWVEEELEIPDTKEKAKALVALIGWTSVQAHLDYRSTQTFKDNIHFLRGAKDLKHVRVFHVHTTEVKKE